MGVEYLYKSIQIQAVKYINSLLNEKNKQKISVPNVRPITSDLGQYFSSWTLVKCGTSYHIYFILYIQSFTSRNTFTNWPVILSVAEPHSSLNRLIFYCIWHQFEIWNPVRLSDAFFHCAWVPQCFPAVHVTLFTICPGWSSWLDLLLYYLWPSVVCRVTSLTLICSVMLDRHRISRDDQDFSNWSTSFQPSNLCTSP